jgi:hypothetical protein
MFYKMRKSPCRFFFVIISLRFFDVSLHEEFENNKTEFSKKISKISHKKITHPPIWAFFFLSFLLVPLVAGYLILR